MMGHCPTCGKLVPIVPALRDTFGRPRKRVVPHESWGGPDPRWCLGSNKTI